MTARAAPGPKRKRKAKTRSTSSTSSSSRKHTHRHRHPPGGRLKMARGLLKAISANKRMKPASKAKARATIKRKYGVG